MHRSRLRWVICLSGILVSTGANWLRGQGEESLHWPRSQKQAPGVELTLEEVTRQPGTRGTQIVYRIRSSGFPRDKTYRLQTSSFSSASLATRVTAIEASDTGSLAVGRVNDQPVDLSKFTLAIENYNRGEFFMIEAVSEDGAVYARDRVHPFPIEARDGDCHLWAELGSADKRNFAITGIGFGPDTEVRITFSEEGVTQSQHGVQRAGPDGVFTTSAGHRSRGGAATFVAAGDSCQVTLRYDFGRQAKGPL
jgi:hypothetical protein